MKTIKFNKLKLLNFCGIREGEYEFGDNITTVSGKNGVGKSTLASAITYALFGSDIKGRALDIKTLDENNQVIRDVAHEVELFLSVDGDSISLKRVLTDSWKEDSVKNTFKYFVDGQPSTAGEFKKVVDGICQEKTFRLCSSPTEFVSMNWQEQYAFLKTLIPSITFEDITCGDEKFDFVKESVKKNDTDSFLSKLKYERKETQKHLDQIPTRLNELNKLLPNEEIDWAALAKEIEARKAVYTDACNKISAINSGNSDDVAKEGIRNKLSFANKRLANMEQSARNEATREAEKHQSDILACQQKVDKATREVDELKATIRSCTDTRVNVGKHIENLKLQSKTGSKSYSELYDSQWKWNDNDSFCPHCGQPLPSDKLEEIKRKSKEKFDSDKATKLKELLELATSIKKELAESKKQLEDNDKLEADTLYKLKEANQELSDAEREQGKVNLEKPKSYELILSEKEEYSKVKDEIVELQRLLDKPSTQDDDTKELLSLYYEKRDSAYKMVETLSQKYAQKESYDKIRARIAAVNEGKVNILKKLDELDRQISIVSEYVRKSFEILSERVNEKFSFVKWIMFQATNDGDKKPYCECSHNGVPYSSLNGASKINAGIDIAHTISQFYEIEIPMLIDNSESVQKPIYNGGQQIRFAVGNCRTLDFEYSDGSQD